MSFSGCCSKAAFLRSCSQPRSASRSGDPAATSSAPCSPACSCSPNSPCRCTIRQPSLWGLSLRASLLAGVAYLLASLALAESRYARAWPPLSVVSSVGEMEIARTLYPFEARFRDGRRMRLKVFAETGE